MNTVLITGANKGIGYEVARQLAGKGFQVFVGARNRDAGQKAVAKIAEEGGKAIFLEIDVADNPSVTVAAREFAKAADHLDVLVNNAGIIVDGRQCNPRDQRRAIAKDVRDKYARRVARNTRIRAFAQKKQSAARDQCFQWRRAVDRRR